MTGAYLQVGVTMYARSCTSAFGLISEHFPYCRWLPRNGAELAGEERESQQLTCVIVSTSSKLFKFTFGRGIPQFLLAPNAGSNMKGIFRWCLDVKL